MPETIKRNIAYKFRIGTLKTGKPVMNGDRFSYLELQDKRVVRVNVVGNVIDKFSNEGEKKYASLTLDDGSGQIRIKSFGDDIEKLKDITQGHTLLVIGVLRIFNDELYISPEIIRIMQPEYLLVRKLETEKQNKNSESIQQVDKEKIIELKDSILEIIKNSENNGGIEIDQIIMQIKESSPELINQEIQKMLEDGMIFEPRPGKLRYLG